MIVDKSGYLGFTYNGKHSSEFNIIRVSDGSRFNQNLLPTIQDKTIQVPGAAGKIFQRADYDTRVFSIQIAYDNMSEQDMQNMRTWLGDKKIHKLVFDELPYKTWYAKVTGTASMKWLPFKEGKNNRLYKGEGTVQFTCYDPFAHCSNKWFESQGVFTLEEALAKENWEEWIESSGLLATINKTSTLVNGLMIDENGQLKTTDGTAFDTQDYYLLLQEGSLTLKYGYLTYLTKTKQSSWIPMYNCGDVETGFRLSINFIDNGKVGNEREVYIPKGGLYLARKITDEINGETVTRFDVVGGLEWDKMFSRGNDTKIVVNTKMNLIEGHSQNEKSGIIYDDNITSGTYFCLPVGDYYIYPLFLDEENNPMTDISKILNDIEFDYLYL